MSEREIKQHDFPPSGMRCQDCGTTRDDAPDQYCKPKYVGSEQGEGDPQHVYPGNPAYSHEPPSEPDAESEQTTQDVGEDHPLVERLEYDIGTIYATGRVDHIGDTCSTMKDALTEIRRLEAQHQTMLECGATYTADNQRLHDENTALRAERERLCMECESWKRTAEYARDLLRELNKESVAESIQTINDLYTEALKGETESDE
jgi:hypothetical protein